MSLPGLTRLRGRSHLGYNGCRMLRRGVGPAIHALEDKPMRPTLLNPLFAPVTTLQGVGPKQDKLLQYLLSRSETPRLVDLLLHLPASVIDRRARPKIRDAVQGTVVTLEVTVDRHRPPPPRHRRAPYLIYASDDTGDVVLTYFRSPPGLVEKLLPVGAKRFVSGTLQMYDG